MFLVGNSKMVTSKVADIIDSKAIGRITKVFIMKTEGAIEGVFMLAKILKRISKMVGKIKMSVKIRMIPMGNGSLFRNNLYLYPYRLQQLVSKEQQQ